MLQIKFDDVIYDLDIAFYVRRGELYIRYPKNSIMKNYLLLDHSYLILKNKNKNGYQYYISKHRTEKEWSIEILTPKLNLFKLVDHIKKELNL